MTEVGLRARSGWRRQLVAGLAVTGLLGAFCSVVYAWTAQASPATAAQTGQWGSLINWPTVAMHGAVLSDGNVLTYGDTSQGHTAYLWNPTTNAFASVPDSVANPSCGGTNVLPDGRVITVGGGGVDNSDDNTNVTGYQEPNQTWARLASNAYPTPGRRHWRRPAGTSPNSGGGGGGLLVVGTAGTSPAGNGSPGASLQGGGGGADVSSGGGGGGGFDGGGGGGAGDGTSVANFGGGGGGGGSSYGVTGLTYNEGIAGTASVTIRYTLPDTVSLAQPGNITVDATNPAGATVSYANPAATDALGLATPSVTCDPAPGSTFPVGATTVTCTATDPDATPNSVSVQFTVTVVPVSVLSLAQPADITTDATGSHGSTVAYQPLRRARRGG